MIKIINEEKIANDLINNNKLINKDTVITLRCYIKYLKNHKKSKKEIRNLVDELMLNYYDGFVMADWDKELQKMVNKYSKPKNCGYKKMNDEVIIYKSELDIISNIGSLSGFSDIEIEKLLFVMTVLAKSNGGEWVSYSSEDIFKLAKFKYKTKTEPRNLQREKLIYDLVNFKQDKLLHVTNYGKHPSIKLLFIKEDGEIGLKVKIEDIEKIIVQYLDYRNKDKYNYCAVCGKEIKTKSNRQRYCNVCAKQQIKERDKIRKRKIPHLEKETDTLQTQS